MVDVAQSVRVTDCGSEGRGFESHLPPLKTGCEVFLASFFVCIRVSEQAPASASNKKALRATVFSVAIW